MKGTYKTQIEALDKATGVKDTTTDLTSAATAEAAEKKKYDPLAADTASKLKTLDEVKAVADAKKLWVAA